MNERDIRELRQFRGRTLVATAAATRISRNRLSLAERGRKRLSDDELSRIRDYLALEILPGHEFQRRRLSRGLTQDDAATISGISQSTISKYESGVLELPFDSAQSLMTVLWYSATIHPITKKRTYWQSPPSLSTRRNRRQPGPTVAAEAP